MPAPQGLKTGLDDGWRTCIGGSFQRVFGLADVEAAETTLDEGTACGDDFLVQAVVVAAQYDDAAMCDDHRVGQRRISHHAC